MINRGLMILNLNVPCSCACEYCLLSSCKKANGIPYLYGKKIALRFDEWRKKKKLNNFELSYTVGYCADYPEIADNIELNKYFGALGFSYLQINGIGFKDEEELTKYICNIKKAGITYIDITLYGFEEYHDKFAGRKGDYKYLIRILNTAQEFGIIPLISFPITEDNKNQIDGLIELLQENVNTDVQINGFLHDYWGRGKDLESARLQLQSYNELSDKVKCHVSVSRYKTEEEWLKTEQFTQYTSRNLNLTLRPDNIAMFEAMNCDEIMDYLIKIDEKYYNAIPDIHELAYLYGNKNSQKLYRQRDLQWKWQSQFIKDNKLNLPDITDERLCGSMRH